MNKNTYRGKRKDNGEWAYGYYVKHDTVKICLSSDDPETKHYIAQDGFCDWGLEPPIQLYEVIPETVGRCTGLQDKNGKAIFEGDICRNTKTKDIVSVKWHGTMAGYVWSKKDKDGFLYSFGELFRAHDKYEIIGNIHDNPEILEGV